MIRRLFRFLLPGGVLLAGVVLVRRTMRLRDDVARVVPSRDRWTPVPAPATAPTIDRESAPTPDPSVAAWLPPVDEACPPTHPIKAKQASGIYHLPGMVNYQRTKPDRCYAEESAAVTDGFTKAKR